MLFLKIIFKENEIKVLAKKGQEQAARTLAKQLIRTREQKAKLMNMKSQLSSQSTQVKVSMEFIADDSQFFSQWQLNNQWPVLCKLVQQ